MGQQPRDTVVGDVPAPQLPEQHHEERRRVDRAVVDVTGAQRGAGRGAEAHLVEDLARLLLGGVVRRHALEAGQRLEHTLRERGLGEQRHPRGEQRVAAEHGHEPRCARGQDRHVGVVGVEDPQRTQVVTGLVQCPLEPGMVGVHRGERRPPLGQALRGDRVGVGAAAPEPRREGLVAERGDALHTPAPRFPRAEDHRPAQRPVDHRRRVGSSQCDRFVDPAVVDRELEPVGARGTGSCRPLDDPALLHLEEVGEIDVAAELHRHVDGVGPVVGDGEPLPHALTHGAIAEDDDVGIGSAGRRVGPTDEQRAERLGHVDGERFDRVPVDQQLPGRQHPGVEDEQPVRRVRTDVARPVGEAEGLALDQGDGAVGAPERRRWRDGARVALGVGQVPQATRT